jgi:L-threonylcarbamoyladenylate synthase
MPNEKNILKLISIVGPVFSSSANISGNEVFKNVFEAKKDFDNIKNLIFVDGKKNSSLPSTIINFDTKEIIREGCISGSEIIKLLK